MIDVAGNWQSVRDRVEAATRRAGRPPGAVTIVAVGKTQSAAAVAAAIDAGATDVGENYVQEAAAKMPLVGRPARWHLIGHLQRNKSARAVDLFDVIHTLDSVALGRTLAALATARQRVIRVLVEINLGAEASKSGVAPAALPALLRAFATVPVLVIDGLMAIPPPQRSAEAMRPFFRALRELRDAIAVDAAPNAPLRELSMGMSDDFEVAIEEGATLVRIGRAIFGERS
ncbi:YggS family pyridoxal phosphate-dependent enzyme [Candidatus Binatia bacterium]|nr:YggS family pyridoxal phosphate-dependent enzyme [Candidatus Binatia bacterium]